MEEMCRFLQERDHYLILTHRRPDGDTLGSAAALCQGLRTIGKTAFVAVNPEVTPRYLPYVAPYAPHGGFKPQTILTVDTAARSVLPAAWREWDIQARIDHHPTDGTYAPVNYVEPKAAACAEIIMLLLRKLGVALTADIAAPLYLGISTDTGCFRYASTTSRSHRLASDLLDTGIPAAEIDEMVFSRKTPAQVKVESAVWQGMEYLSEGRIALGTLSLEMVRQSGAVEDDLENISALPRQILDVVIGITIRQSSTGCKYSVRTVMPYQANQICAQLGGGGHERAGGCWLDDSDLSVARRAILKAVKTCYPEDFGGIDENS